MRDNPGDVVDTGGRVVGRHGGHHRFTVGQRKGLGIAAGEPLYVVSKDARTNRVVVGPRARLATRTVPVTSTVLHRADSCVDRVKLRYRSEPVPCRVVAVPGDNTAEILLDEPAGGVAPGQTACFMDGERVVGHATIAA